MIERIRRNTAIVCVVLAAMAGALSRDARMVGGVLAGGLLVLLALWALTGVVDAVAGTALRAGAASAPVTRELEGKRAGKRAVSRAFSLVKFFTRHAILALVAYVMMVRLHLDPVGMVVGVTSVVVAAILEAARPR